MKIIFELVFSFIVGAFLLGVYIGYKYGERGRFYVELVLSDLRDIIRKR